MKLTVQVRLLPMAQQVLRRIRRRESKFRRNHVVSKAIVASAKGTARGIALEDLKGIRERTTVRKKQRNRHSGWAFHKLADHNAALNPMFKARGSVNAPDKPQPPAG